MTCNKYPFSLPQHKNEEAFAFFTLAMMKHKVQRVPFKLLWGDLEIYDIF